MRETIEDLEDCARKLKKVSECSLAATQSSPSRVGCRPVLCSLFTSVNSQIPLRLYIVVVLYVLCRAKSSIYPYHSLYSLLKVFHLSLPLSLFSTQMYSLMLSLFSTQMYSLMLSFKLSSSSIL